MEVWITLGDVSVKFLTELFNRLLRGEGMPEEWRKSKLVPLYKGKGDTKECGNYWGIKLMSYNEAVGE